MRNVLYAVMAVFLSLAGSLSPAAAQNAIPAAGGAVIPTGTAVTIAGNDGAPSATLTVDALTDPFTGFDPSNAPQRGFHYVAIDVSLFAAGSAQVAVSGFFIAVDAEGFSYQQTYVNRPSAESRIPDLNNSAADPGQAATGVVFFEVLNGVTIDRIVYQPAYQRWITVLDLRASVVAPGTTISFLDANGQPAAAITVTGIVDPLTEFDPNSAPPRGFEYAGVNVTVKNTGSSPFDIAPSSFLAVDADGFSANYTGVYRGQNAIAAKPDLKSVTLAPGEFTSGIVTYQLLKGDAIDKVIFTPAKDRAVEVANLGLTGIHATATPVPHASPTVGIAA